ncbi:hypothetical protein QBC39DRAFT_184281 [Podospora conica]|nr:hypothetical protein QBC39DRAFT_184281 [Schizothecium conicum]
MKLFKRRSKRASDTADAKRSMSSEKKRGSVQTVEVDPEEQLDCPICRDPVGIVSESGTLEHWRLLPCNHKFGRDCIRTYLDGGATPADKPLCPMCRAPVYHTCGHVALPTAPGAPLRPTSAECDFCAICNSPFWKRLNRRRQPKPRAAVWKRVLLKMIPRNTKTHWGEGRTAIVEAAKAYDLYIKNLAWKDWWDDQDQQQLPKA